MGEFVATCVGGVEQPQPAYIAFSRCRCNDPNVPARDCPAKAAWLNSINAATVMEI